MFTKEDYQEYFSQIQKKENQMVEFVKNHLRDIKNDDIATGLKEILKDEIRHSEIAKELFEFLQ